MSLAESGEEPSPDRLVEKAVGLRRAGDRAASAATFEQALAIHPRHAGALSSYAMLLLELGDLENAVRVGTRAVDADPRRSSAHHVLGQALCLSGAHAEGIKRLREAIALRQDAFDIHLHLGNALLESGDIAGAERHGVIARDLAPTLAVTHLNLGNLYRKLGRSADAILAFRQAISLDRSAPSAHNNLGFVLAELGDTNAAIDSFQRALEADPDRAATWSNLLLTLQRSDRFSAPEVVEQHRAFGRYFGGRVRQLSASHVGPIAGRRLKVGYVSADFQNHAVALFVEPVLTLHDRRRFEVYCFHVSKATDDLTERLSAVVEHFVPSADLSDLDLANYIRQEKIDILVDLNGHTSGNRLTMFLMKPAPLQVTWLGYLATTGLATIDYRLTDAQADPPGLSETMHTESLWRLPDTLWCYRPYEFAPGVGPLPAIRNGRVTFGSLNNAGKVSPAVVALWGRILAAIPESRMVLITDSLPERAEILNRSFADFGVSPDRIEHLSRQSTLDYLQLYNRIDVALDTWPYGGGATTCDALWMGVPVVTLATDRSFSRGGASILQSVGIPELVAGSGQDYVSRAVALGSDIARLQSLRSRLREQMRASSLTDAPRFTAALEGAFLAMANGEAPI